MGSGSTGVVVIQIARERTQNAQACAMSGAAVREPKSRA
jgi:hypothetical protein